MAGGAAIRAAGADYRIRVAGRELGSGASGAIRRLVPDLFEERMAQLRREYDGHHPSTKEQFPWDEHRAEARAGAFAHGVAVGLVMAEDPEAIATLDAIHREWAGASAGPSLAELEREDQMRDDAARDAALEE